jgi:type II secretory pathway pseudopilin PulG
MTLLELTVVILVLLTLITVMFVGVNAWKKGANRTTCILNIRTVQMAVRGYGNINGLEPGQATATPLKDELIGDDKRIAADPDCPGGGAYSFAGNTIPSIGDLYMTCSLSSTLEHAPTAPGSW